VFMTPHTFEEEGVVSLVLLRHSGQARRRNNSLVGHGSVQLPQIVGCLQSLHNLADLVRSSFKLVPRKPIQLRGPQHVHWRNRLSVVPGRRVENPVQVAQQGPTLGSARTEHLLHARMKMGTAVVWRMFSFSVSKKSSCFLVPAIFRGNFAQAKTFLRRTSPLRMAASALTALADALAGHGGPGVAALTAVNKALLHVCAGAGAAARDEGFLRQAWPLLRKCAEWAWALVPSLAAEPLPKSYRRLWFELLHACGTASDAEAAAPGPVPLCCADKTDVLWTVAKTAKWASALPEGERWVWGCTLSEPLVAWFDALVLPMDRMASAVALAQVFVGCWPWDLSGWVTETCAGHPRPFLVSFTAKQPFYPKLPQNMARAMVMCWHRNCDLAEEDLQRCAECIREPGQGAIDTPCMSPACMPQHKCTCARDLIYFLIHATRLVGMVGDSIPSITDPVDIEAYAAVGRFLGAAMGPWGFRHVKQVFWSHTGVVLDWLLRVWLTQCTWTEMFMSRAGEERWLPLAALTARLMLEHDFARGLGTFRPMLQPEELLFSVQHTVNPSAWCHGPLRGVAASAVAVLALAEKDEAAAAVHYHHLLCCLRVIPLAWPTGVGAPVLSSIALRTARVCQSGKFGALDSQETMEMLTTAMQYRLALERDIESALCRAAELVGLVGDLEQWVPLLQPWSDQPWVRVWWMMCLEAEGRTQRHHAKVLYKVSRLGSVDERSRDLQRRALALGCMGVEDVLASAPFADDAMESLLRTAPRHRTVSENACGGKSWVHVPMCGLLMEATKFLMQLAVCVLPQRTLPGRDNVAVEKIRNKSKRWADKVVRDGFKSCRTTLVRPDPVWAEFSGSVLRVLVRWAQVIGDCTDDALRLAFAPKGDDVYMWRDHFRGPVMALYIAAGCCYAEAPEGPVWRGVCKVAGAFVSRWVLSWDEHKWDSLRTFGRSYSGDRSWITAVMTMDYAIRVSPETCTEGVSDSLPVQADGVSGILPLEAVAVLTLHTHPGLRLARDVFRRFRVVEHAIESGDPVAAEEILRCALFVYWAHYTDIVEMTDQHATALVSVCDLYGDAWTGKPQTALWRKKWDMTAVTGRIYAGPMTTVGRIAGAMTRVQVRLETGAGCVTCVFFGKLNPRLRCVYGVAGVAGAAMVAPAACLGAERRQGSRSQANSVYWDTANKVQDNSAPGRKAQDCWKALGVERARVPLCLTR
jgi:hypothetical protein